MSVEKHGQEFLAALNGQPGALDAWLECYNEADVRAAVNYAIELQSIKHSQICEAIALKHQQIDGTYAAGKKAGALECLDAIKA